MAISQQVRSFAGGIWSQNLWQRNDLEKYATACQVMKNFVPFPQGGVENRTGLKYIVATKSGATKKSVLVPFIFSIVQNYLLEFGDQYIRFVRNDVQELDGGLPYEVVTPYLEADLELLKFEQSADVMYITHPSYAPAKLSRTGHTSWTLTSVVYGASIAAPTSLARGASGSEVVAITAINDNGEESALSNIVTDASTTSVLTWVASAGAVFYNVYKRINGIWGFLKQVGAVTTYTLESALTPDFSKAPPTSQNYFGSSSNYPGVSSFFQQRLWYGRTDNNPQTLYGSNVGSFDNFNDSTPAQDDDGCVFAINSQQVNEVKHIVPLTDSAIILTGGAEFRMRGGSDQAITPTNVFIERQSSWGASDVKPQVVNNSIIFVDRSGRRVRDLTFNIQFEAYQGNEVSITAQDLFKDGKVKQACFQQFPNPIIWFVMTDGRLLGFSYNKEQEVNAWHQHETLGLFESCAVLPNASTGGTDVYFIIKRTINGSTVRYIEKLTDRNFSSIEECFFVDAGTQYDGSATVSLAGLSHLEGASVAVLADGNVVKGLTVSGGAITLPVASSKVSVGLPYNSELKPMKFVVDTQQGTTQDKTQLISSVFVNLKDTRGLSAGSSADGKLNKLVFTSQGQWANPAELFNGSKEIFLEPNRSPREATVYFKVDDPVPCTILNCTARVSYGSQ